MRRLSGVDADLLYVDVPDWHLHVGGLLVLEPGEGSSFEEVRAGLIDRIREVPALQERLVEVPFELDTPLWVRGRVDVDEHLHHRTVAPPGAREQLAAVVGELASRKLDRGRPLWEAWYLDGLAEGRTALFVRVHHAAADGVASALLVGQLLGTEPSAPPPAAPGDGVLPAIERVPTGPELLARAAGRWAGLPVRLARTAGRTAAAALRLAGGGETGREGARAAAPFRAPASAFNGKLTPRRAVSFARLDFAAVRATREATGTTVNDVVLAVCAGALRRYLQERDELPAEPLIAAVPVSVRGEQDATALGNRVSGWFADLATHLDDPVERLATIAAAARRAKRVYDSGIEDVVMGWAELQLPLAIDLGARLLSRTHLLERFPPIFNLLVSNVPGSPVPLYAGRARVEAIHPFGPVLGGVGLNITVLSYAGSVDVGIQACPTRVSDPWALADAFAPALEELRAAG